MSAEGSFDFTEVHFLNAEYISFSSQQRAFKWAVKAFDVDQRNFKCHSNSSGADAKMLLKKALLQCLAGVPRELRVKLK